MSLSAWCGTAARLIVRGDETFLLIDHIGADPRVHLEALDAHAAWPPLLKPGVLTGHDAYDRWESRLITDCFTPVSMAASTLGPRLASALAWTDRLRQWRPSEGALSVLVDKPFVQHDRSWLSFWHITEQQVLDQLLTPLMAAVPRPWQAAEWPAGLTDATLAGPAVTREDAEAALARYGATRLVGSWVAYQGEGLRSVLASLVAAYGLAALALRRNGDGIVTIGRLTAALRATDWLLLHLLDRDQWAGWCSRWESAGDAAPLLGLVAGAASILDELTWA